MQAIRFDSANLFPECPGLRFNPSIIASGDGYLIAWRDAWKFSRLYAGRLDKDFQPVGQGIKLGLPEGTITRCLEDPRWFRVGGKLHLYVAAFSGRSNHCCYAPIDEATLKVESFWWPQNAEFRRWEKNHVPFDYRGEIHAIYETKPAHRILRYYMGGDGEDPQAKFVYCTHFDGAWSGGLIRGGAAPVMHQGEWYHFFHGSTVQENGRRLYNCGVVTFAPEPPFPVLRYTPEPIDVADPKATPKAEKSDVIFPGGAVVYGDHWAVAHGVNDTWSEIRFYPMTDIEERLVKHG